MAQYFIATDKTATLFVIN